MSPAPQCQSIKPLLAGRMCVQVCWILSAAVHICEQQGVEYDAEEKTRSKHRKQISSYQNADEGQGASAHQVSGCGSSPICHQQEL